jgi:SPX domain
MLPIQLAFFDKLNLELSKVEHFFIEREAEARARSLELREQLEELKDHRRLFHVTRLRHVILCAADRRIKGYSPRGSSSYCRALFLVR